MKKHRPAYLKIRRWVDAQLGSTSVPERNAPFGAAAVVFVVPLLLAYIPSAPSWAIFTSWLVAALLWLPWTAFVVWRAARLIRAGDYKSARDYDRRGKFLLPPEYAASESHLSHKRRARKAQP